METLFFDVISFFVHETFMLLRSYVIHQKKGEHCFLDFQPREECFFIV